MGKSPTLVYFRLMRIAHTDGKVQQQQLIPPLQDKVTSTSKQLNLPCLVVSLSSCFSSLENGSTHDIVARMTPTNKEAFLVEK